MDRGQVHTLEAFTSAVIMLAGVLFALQMTAVTPLTASTSSQHIENQQAAVAEAVLASADEEGNLKEAVLYWNEPETQFYKTAGQGAYTRGGPPSPPIEFGETLNETFRDRGIAFNVNLYYMERNRTVRGGPERLVFLGNPSDHAVTATRTITLYDDDQTLTASGAQEGSELSTINDTYFADDISNDTVVYNVIMVEVVVWRM